MLAKVTLECKRDAGYRDEFTIEMVVDERLDKDAFVPRIRAKRGFEALMTVDGEYLNLDRYYYYVVANVEYVEEDESTGSE